MIPRLKVNYDKEMSKNLMNKLNVKNRHEVPKITKMRVKNTINSLASKIDQKIIDKLNSINK